MYSIRNDLLRVFASAVIVSSIVGHSIRNSLSDVDIVIINSFYQVVRSGGVLINNGSRWVSAIHCDSLITLCGSNNIVTIGKFIKSQNRSITDSGIFSSST